MAKNISVPDELYYLIKYFKDEMNCTFGEALYWILDNSQYFPPIEGENLGHVGSQWYDMSGRMMGIGLVKEGLKPLEANPREWHKARGAAQDTYQQEDLLSELSNMLDGR
jgi:hypothetical protein